MSLYPKAQLRLSRKDTYRRGGLHENERHRSGKYFAMTFPYSNSGYMQLNYGENLECLLESMKSILEHMGGVPAEVWFGNTRTIVSKKHVICVNSLNSCSIIIF